MVDLAPLPPNLNQYVTDKDKHFIAGALTGEAAKKLDLEEWQKILLFLGVSLGKEALDELVDGKGHWDNKDIAATIAGAVFSSPLHFEF